MSTAHEVIVAAHCGMQCLGFSLITNVQNDISHEEVLGVGKERCKHIEKIVKCVVQKLN
jgi:purine-nucleoside phosphorylase